MNIFEWVWWSLVFKANVRVSQQNVALGNAGQKSQYQEFYIDWYMDLNDALNFFSDSKQTAHMATVHNMPHMH